MYGRICRLFTTLRESLLARRGGRGRAKVKSARRWRLPAAALLCAALALLAAAPGSLAAAGTGPGNRAAPRSLPYGVTAHVYQVMMAQLPLDKAATRIQTAAARPGAGHAGFFETQVSDATHTLTVHWHGPVPADIMRLITSLRRTVHIQIAPSRYSLAVLNQQIQRALRQHGVVGGYPLNDGSGIALQVQSSRMTAAVPALRADLTVPLRATASGGERLQATCTFAPGDTAGPGHRCYDLPPGFWGGDVIQSVYAGCTAGFGVHNASGGLYMMTAAHCADNGNGGYSNGITFQNGNKTATLGQITDVPGPHDGALIPTSAGNRYYDGPGIYAGDSSFTKAVAGQLATSAGDSLCESGAFGGVICGMNVTSLHFTDGTWNSMALASSATGRYTIAGDSGGPWFSLAGSSSVEAQGIHHGITLNGSGAPSGEIFTPMSVLSTDLGVSVNS